MQFGEKLRLLRERHGVSQQQLARYLGFNKSYIGALEHGRKTPTVVLVIKIAKFFGTTVDSLVRDEVELDEQ